MEGIGEGIGKLMNGMLAVIVISVPLAIWKAIEIVWWLLTHIKVEL